MSFLPSVVPRIQQKVVSLPIVESNPRLKSLLEHPAGPFTIHFWAPSFKWFITFANIADLSRPVEKVSVPQQSAVALTGVIWSRYSTQITPVNYNLLSVNLFMAVTGLYQLYRVATHKPAAEPVSAVAAAAPATPAAVEDGARSK